MIWQPKSSGPLTPPRLVILVVALTAMLAVPGRAQAPAGTLTLGLLERYFDALRLEFGMPGLSYAVVDNDRVWARGLGLADVASNVEATADTPYPVLGVTQSVAAALTLAHCVDSGRGTLGDPVARWTTRAEPGTTLGHLLTHTQPGGTYQFSPSRFAVLATVAAECANDEFDELLADGILDRLAMVDAMPGLDALTSSRAQLFSVAQRDRYASALRRLAPPYKLDGRGTAARSEFASTGISAASGLVASVRDLAQFDAALSRNLLLSPALQATAWTPQTGRPTGLGWFVQSYNGQRVVWQFGVAKDAYSSIILKVPDRRLALIVLANSDAVSSALDPQAPDVTQSLFARTFLRLFIS